MEDNILKRILRPSARGKVWQLFVVIIALFVIGGLVDFGSYYNKSVNWLSAKTGETVNLPLVKELPYKLGLDLQGGTHLVYQADVSQVPAGDESSAVEGVRDVIERRVNVFGVSEPVVQVNRAANGEYRIIAELAGISDVNQAIRMIGETPLLEFKTEGDETRILTEEEAKFLKETNEAADKKAEEVLGKLISGGDFNTLANEYSEAEVLDNRWIDSVLNPLLSKAAKELKPNQISDIVKVDGGLAILKLNEKRTAQNQLTGEDKFEVKARHLLICHNEADGCSSDISKDEAYAKIKEIKDKITPENFITMVQENSNEPYAEETGGDLDWFAKGEMVTPFEDAVFEQEVGTISYVVETKFGYHLILKEDERLIEEYNISDIFFATLDSEDITGPATGWNNTGLTGKNLKRASVQFNPNDNAPEINLEFDAEGSELFAQITGENIGKQIAIFLDGYVISAPTVNSKITGGQAVISGKFTLAESKELVQELNAGALPVPINLISQKTVGASLGSDSIANSLKAGIWGIIAVAIFMIFYYRLPGLLSVISLIFYGVLVLALFKLWPSFTLTLSGLAGFILSIGMAVDANVLIFERFKEEIKNGKSVSKSIDQGFKRAWPSIRDGNMSTLITCFILIQFSTGVVKGFALTLGLGVLVSMFSAIVVTKTLLLLVPSKILNNKFLRGV